jgi:hypothetical protein
MNVMKGQNPAQCSQQAAFGQGQVVMMGCHYACSQGSCGSLRFPGNGFSSSFLMLRPMSFGGHHPIRASIGRFQAGRIRVG